jgi:hypothetical protein
LSDPRCDGTDLTVEVDEGDGGVAGGDDGIPLGRCRCRRRHQFVDEVDPFGRHSAARISVAVTRPAVGVPVRRQADRVVVRTEKP